MRVAVLGTGYVGLVVGAGLADLGLMVTCVDVEEAKIALLRQGTIPIFEPGLEELVRRNVQARRLVFSTDVGGAVADSLVVFLCVGTDTGAGGQPDLCQVWKAADLIAQVMADYKVVVIKSTVPVGTAADLSRRVASRVTGPVDFDVVANPEFLREGSAVDDFFHPNRVVIGTTSECAKAIMKDVYRPLYLIHTPFVFTTWENAELIKYAANAFLALKISFANELANLCDAVGPSADVHVISHALGLDPRIGAKFLHPSPGFGGYCLPKDIRALAQMARSYQVDFQTVEAAIAVNERQYLRVIDKVRRGLGGSLEQKCIAVLGLSFKPNTDDVRESRALKICQAMLAEGCSLRVFDPAAMPHARRLFHQPNVLCCSNAYEAVEDSDAVVVCTEWNEFRSLDLERVKQLMRGDVLVDAKNIFEVEKARQAGFRYFAMGRG